MSVDVDDSSDESAANAAASDGGYRVDERLQDHDTRITKLERWRERITGGLMVLSAIVGSGVLGGIIVQLLF